MRLGTNVLLRLVLGGVLAASAAAAQPSNGTPAEKGGVLEHGSLLSAMSLTGRRGPVEVRADELEFEYQARRLTYRGSVVVTQDDMTLSSDSLRVVIDEKAKDKVREVLAEGHVRISQGARSASGGRATFDSATRTIVLSENAVLREGPNEVAGDRVRVFLDEQRSVVEGGVRARLVPTGEAEPTKKGGGDGR